MYDKDSSRARWARRRANKRKQSRRNAAWHCHCDRCRQGLQYQGNKAVASANDSLQDWQDN